MTTSLRQRSLCTSRSSYSPTGSRVMVPRTAFCTSRTRLSDANAHASNFSHLKHNPQAAANQHGQVKSQTIISNLQGDGAPALIQNADWIKQCGANLEIRPAFLQQQQGANGSTRLQNQPQLEPISISMDDWNNRSPITSEEDSLKSLPELKSENERLKEDVQCKVCFDREVDTVFLPCGHLACCTQCSEALKNCPICRKYISATVKATTVK